MTTESPEVWRLPVPLVVEARRLALSSRLLAPRQWLDALLADVPTEEIVAAFEAELANPERLISPTTWASEDLPAEEVYSLDEVGDIIATLNWILLIRRPTRLAIGPVAFLHRERVLSMANALPGEAVRIGELLGVGDAENAGTAINELWREAIARERQREAERVKLAALDEGFIRAIEASVNSERRTSFPRALLSSRGLVLESEEPPPAGATRTSSASVPKIFFVGDADHVARPADFGSSFARSLASLEDASLAYALHTNAGASVFGGDLPDQLAEATSKLSQRGFSADAIFLWGTSQQINALYSDARFHFEYPRGGDGAIGRFEDLPVYMVPALQDGSGYVVDMTSAIRETVFLRDGALVTLSVRDATEEETQKRAQSSDSALEREAYAIAVSTEAYELVVRKPAVVAVGAGTHRERGGLQG